MAENTKLRFNMDRASTDVHLAEGFWGTLGNSALWLAKGTFNVGASVLEDLPDAVARKKESLDKK